MSEFKLLITSFLERQVSASSFEKQYLELWRKYRENNAFDKFTAEKKEMMEQIFTAVDSYCEDSDLRDDLDLDDEALYDKVKRIYNP
jgi:hypothetical protein